MQNGVKFILYETKFDIEKRIFTGWKIIYEDEKNQIIRFFW